MSNLGEDGAIERPGNEFLPERGDENSSRATRIASIKLPSTPESTRAEHDLEKDPHLTMAGS